MVEKTDLRKLLVLRGPALESQGILDSLGGHFDVHLVKELSEALDAMRERHFDAVLAETADFLPLERGVVTQHAAVVLDTIGDGVCVAGPNGEMVWANRRLRDFPSPVLELLRNLCIRAYEEFAVSGRSDHRRARRFSLMPDDESYYEVLCSPVRDRQGILRQVVAVVVDATNQRRQQLKLNAIDRAGRELVSLQCDQSDKGSKSDVPQRLRILQERIIHCFCEVLNYRHFAVLLLNEQTNCLEMLISEGLDEESEGEELFASTEGNGICGYVAATGRSYICPDVRKDPRYVRGMDGARSSLTVPLRLHDKIIGVLNVESHGIATFGEENRQIAEIFGNYIALAMNILNLLVFERHTTHTQVSGSISAELSGPLNDVITEATNTMEDYIGLDDLRGRLQSIIDRATQARHVVQQFARGSVAGVLGIPVEPLKKDPLLAGKRVLVADDEELIRQTVHCILSQFGCIVDVVADGNEAKEKIAVKPYDLVISDIKMPGANGYEVFAAAKAAGADTEVILITAFGYDPNHSIVRASKKGLSAVLLKPFKVNQLLEECRSALAKRPIA